MKKSKIYIHFKIYDIRAEDYSCQSSSRLELCIKLRLKKNYKINKIK